MFNFHFESVQDRLGIQNTKYIKYNIYHRSKTSLNLFSYLQFTNVMILKYTKSLVNTNSSYTNFTNAHFQKVLISHLTRTMKQKFLH